VTLLLAREESNANDCSIGVIEIPKTATVFNCCWAGQILSTQRPCPIGLLSLPTMPGFGKGERFNSSLPFIACPLDDPIYLCFYIASLPSVRSCVRVSNGRTLTETHLVVSILINGSTQALLHNVLISK
jgi:hypothetical protein